MFLSNNEKSGTGYFLDNKAIVDMYISSTYY